MRRRCFSPIQSWRRFALDHLEPRQLFSAPPLPVIPAGVFNITTYGATTASANNASAIQAAITAATNAGGGTVEVPAGTFMSGPITLASKINLQIDSGAMLKALSMANYPNNTAPSNFISIVAKNNVEISGSGTIDGNGADWWAAYNAIRQYHQPAPPDQRKLFRRNRQQHPLDSQRHPAKLAAIQHGAQRIQQRHR